MTLHPTNLYSGYTSAAGRPLFLCWWARSAGAGGGDGRKKDVAVKYREGISFRYPTFSENGPKFVNILLGFLPEFFPPIYWQIDILLKDHVLGSCYHCLSARCRQHRREEELRICSGDGGDSYLKLGALSSFTLWVHAGLWESSNSWYKWQMVMV